MTQTLTRPTLVEGKGFDFGTIQLPPKFGITLPPMQLWVAPTDLKERLGSIKTFDESLKAVQRLKDFHGRNGLHLSDDAPHNPCEKGVYGHTQMLANGDKNAHAGWIIPTQEIIAQALLPLKDALDNDHAFQHILHAGAGARGNHTSLLDDYMSCTQNPADDTQIAVVDFGAAVENRDRKGDGSGWAPKANTPELQEFREVRPASCRLVALTPIR